MRFSASTIYSWYRPSPCGLRPRLMAQGIERAEPGPYEQVLFRLGQRHEADHLAQLGPHVDLRSGSLEERAEKTLAAIGLGERVLYQPVFIGRAVADGEELELLGIPDFLIRDRGSYRIRDAKLSLHVDEKNHPEIGLQLGLYGFLYMQAVGEPSFALEALLGDQTLEEIPFDGGNAALMLLALIKRTLAESTTPYEPVGWSKCQGCGFRDHCWPRAVERRDVALIYGVDQGLARELHDRGVTTYDELLQQFDEDELTEVVRPWGEYEQRVGARAAGILNQARAMSEERELRLSTPQIPNHDNYVMFDLEGVPPQFGELDKVYLWGMQVFGAEPGSFQAALAGFGPTGDRDAWFDFLRQANAIFDAYGDIPFVHWHHYETTKISSYIDRYGDPEGVAARVRANCLDLLPITRRAIVLPEPSYSLKVVERRVGYERQLEEYGGDWSIAQFIEAAETSDEAERTAIMDEILDYNREDLEATWAVFRWLNGYGGSADR